MADKLPRDELVRSLQQTLRTRRPSRWLFGLALLAFAGGFGVAWYQWATKAMPARLAVVALDDVIAAGGQGVLVGQLVPEEPGKEPSFAGKTAALFRAGETERTSVCDATGRAERPIEKLQQDVEFFAKHIPRDRAGYIFEGATIFVWPADAKILLLDADLATAEDGLPLDACETLKELAKRNYRMVYLTDDLLAQRRPYRTQQGLNLLPVGPIFHPAHAPTASPQERKQRIVDRLKEQFTGPRYVLAGSLEAARWYQKHKFLAPILLSSQESAVGIPRLAGWPDLLKELP